MVIIFNAITIVDLPDANSTFDSNDGGSSYVNAPQKSGAGKDPVYANAQMINNNRLREKDKEKEKEGREVVSTMIDNSWFLKIKMQMEKKHTFHLYSLLYPYPIFAIETIHFLTLL